MNNARQQDLSAMRIACAVFLAGSALGIPIVSAGAQHAARPAASTGPVRGTLLIVGGGTQPNDLVVQFIALAGGPGHARIAILPMASEESAESGRDKKAQLDSMGADAFVVDVTRTQADADSVVKLINGATGIWFPGGDQVRLVEHLQGSAALRAIHERYRAGAVVGGTSAGAAIMSDSMLTGNQFFPGLKTSVDSGVSSRRISRGSIEVIPGLGFLHNAIVDQHFIKRQRENRLISVILERPSFIGVGIDEGTAIRVYPDGHWAVLGASAAIIFDARNATVTPAGAPRLGAVGVRMSVLPAGSTFDPKSGKATLPPG
jgi:cyanophycinase